MVLLGCSIDRRHLLYDTKEIFPLFCESRYSQVKWRLSFSFLLGSSEAFDLNIGKALNAAVELAQISTSQVSSNVFNPKGVSMLNFSLFFPSYVQDVGAFFEEGMWLRYNFHSPGTSMKDLVSRTLLSSPDTETTEPDLNLNKEELSFSFSTTKSPCVLLYISSYTQDFMAVLVKPSGKQPLWAFSIEGTIDNKTGLTFS